MDKKNRGFTLIEMVIVVAIFAILLGIMVPSLNSLLGFRVTRAAKSIGEALDRTRTESMNRLVAEMKLTKTADGYYISYFLDRGKVGSQSHLVEEQPEKIAPAKTQISYKDANYKTYELTEGQSLILTYNRATGGFRPIQNELMTQDAILSDLEAGKDIDFASHSNEKIYCIEIIVQGGGKTRALHLNLDAGSYTIDSNVW